MTEAGKRWMQTPAAQIVTGMADAIAAIEAEAVAAERARIAEAVRGMWMRQTFLAPSEYEAAVLALIEEKP
jgi:hypothetical protein